MKDIYNTYTPEEVTKLVEMLYPNYATSVRYDVTVGRGADVIFDKMEEFLYKLRENGYVIAKADGKGHYGGSQKK